MPFCPRSSVRFRAPPCEGGGRRCNSCRGHHFAPVPQQQQGEFRKLVFVGASPTRGSSFQGRDVTVSISACDADCAGANPVALTILNPVGRLVQAAVCKTAEAGAIPARDSISPGIGVDRHTSVFQTEIERALLSCPSTFLSEFSLPAETPHGRRCWRTAGGPGTGFSAPGIPFRIRGEIMIILRFERRVCG